MDDVGRAEGPLKALKAIIPRPKELKHDEFTEDDKIETMGGLYRLAAQNGRWQDALDAAAEWVGVARGEGHEAALAACCDALQSHKALEVNFSRMAKQYWKML